MSSNGYTTGLTPDTNFRELRMQRYLQFCDNYAIPTKGALTWPLGVKIAYLSGHASLDDALARSLEGFDLGKYDDACADASMDVSRDRIIFRFLTGVYDDKDEDDEMDEKRHQVETVEHKRREAEEEFERARATTTTQSCNLKHKSGK